MHLRNPLGCRFIGRTLIVVTGLVSAAASFGAEQVIHISVDGLNATMMQQLIDEGRAPNFKRFQEEGVWTTNARTDYTHTNTLPNHTCMFTGRPVGQPDGMPDTVHHGCTINDAAGRGGTLHNQGNPNLKYIASVFDVVHDAGLSTGLYAAKDKFELYDKSYDEASGAEHEHGRDKIDVFFTEDDGPPFLSQSVNERFLDDMAKRHFNYVFVHYRDPDTIGHALGWGSGGWFYALSNVDAYLGKVFRLVDRDPKLAGRTAIILTTDHGGIGYGHSDATKHENSTIPVMAWGAGVGRGDLYAINRDTRTDPGTERVDYAAEHQPIRNGDTGDLALSLLGLGPIPGSLINAKQDLLVATPGDYNLDGSVDTADFVLWRKLEGSTDLRADGNRDGRVDKADHEVWKAHLGTSAATSK